MVASLSSSVTTYIGDHGLYAVFVLMAIDAVFPAASELVMLYAGALAAGAFSGQHVVLFGNRIDSHFWAFVTVSLAGVIGYTIGSLIGWGIGAYAGRPLLEERGRSTRMEDHKGSERRSATDERQRRISQAARTITAARTKYST